METALLVFVLALSGVGIAALVGVHFWPERVKRLIDQWQALIDVRPLG